MVETYIWDKSYMFWATSLLWQVQSRGVHRPRIPFWTGVRMLTQHYSSGYYCMNLLSNLIGALEVIQPNVLYKMQVIDMGTRHYNSWSAIFSIVLLNKPPSLTSTPLPNATKQDILTEAYSRLFLPSKTNRDEQFLSLGKYCAIVKGCIVAVELNFRISMESSMEFKKWPIRSTLNMSPNKVLYNRAFLFTIELCPIEFSVL